ncbi:hypothetical protein F4811DRAFT_574109 [Daldinia bambusicola]|nr:hypothetical protein F4811DRAFT_574109 [Daldinia bambusicola]
MSSRTSSSSQTPLTSFSTSPTATSSILITSLTTSSYPLTTVFIPPSDCTSLLLNTCFGTTECVLDMWYEYLCTGNSDGSAQAQVSWISCYPNYRDENAVITYSPGLFCPRGMTTAASAISPAGVWCCPSGLQWAGTSPWCKTRVDASHFISIEPGCIYDGVSVTFGGSGSSANNSQPFVVGEYLTAQDTYSYAVLQPNNVVFTAQAKGVFLEGQTMAPTTTMPDNNISTEAIPSDDGNTTTDRVASHSTSIPGVVCGVFGAYILLGAVYVLWRQRRRRRRRISEAGQGDDFRGAGEDFSGAVVVNVGELSDGHRKAELDALAQATRFELEGPLPVSVPEPSHGAGIYVQKPELEGTRGERHAAGAVYVKNKAELEGRLREVAELEATPLSARKKDQALPPSPTIPRLS